MRQWLERMGDFESVLFGVASYLVLIMESVGFGSKASINMRGRHSGETETRLRRLIRNHLGNWSISSRLLIFSDGLRRC